MTLRPTEAASLLSISRSRLYELIATGEIRARKSGGATLIERAELERYVDSLPEYKPAASA
jgi:excisionase family DNA binding protein